MKNLTESVVQHDIELSKKLNNVVKGAKFVIAVAICWLYAINSVWLTEALIVGLLLTLISPMGFFDVFIQRLLEYNTQAIEERQVLNTTQANQQFEKVYAKLENRDV